ncbi:MAG TPA: hypothetical protein VN943_17980 [Candidatus Acidoferrum sp.]|nr:hypothetical protein [Candidatus Acidoferrum sp.]
MPARSQEPPHPAESVAEAARNAREHKANSTEHPKIITNEDLSMPYSVPDPAFDLQFSSPYGAEAANPAGASCDNPEVARLTRELQAAQQELDQLRRELSYRPQIISDHDLDLRQFRPGYSGFYVGAPPLLETEPPAPARVTEVELEERIASLTRALRVACEPPEAARIQRELDEAEEELNLLQRQFALDQDAYYSRPDYAEDTAGKARLDAELEQVAQLQSEIERLRRQLAVQNTP